MDFCSRTALHQNKKSSFGLCSLPLLKVSASDRGAVDWTEVILLNAADNYVVCFSNGLKFKIFGSLSFKLHVQVQRREALGWTPFRLRVQHRLYLAIHRGDTITISRMMRRCTSLPPPKRQVSFEFRGSEWV